MCYNGSVVAGVVQWLVHGLAKARMPVRFWSLAPFVKIVGTTDVEIKLNSKELSFFVSKKDCDDMLNIIKEKLDLSPDLKKKIDWAKNLYFYFNYS